MKKKRLSARWLHKIAGNRFFLAMKLNFFLMFFVVLSASANIDVMSQRVNLDFKNTDLSTVFKSLESQTGHIFVYSADRVQADQIQVSIQLKDTELKQALEVLFKDLPYKYSVEGQSVLIIPVPRQIPGKYLRLRKKRSLEASPTRRRPSGRCYSDREGNYPRGGHRCKWPIFDCCSSRCHCP